MSGTYALRKLARSDVDAIGVNTVRQWGVHQAECYPQGLLDFFEELAANPLLGCERDDVKAGYRSFPQGRHMEFYLIASAGVEGIGIVHQSADVDTHLGVLPHDESC